MPLTTSTGFTYKKDTSLVSILLHFFQTSNNNFSVLYHMPARQDAAAAKADLARREEELQALKTKHNIKDED
jgi:pre-mRNA branch site protein p14